jgi:hypothetical protein
VAARALQTIACEHHAASCLEIKHLLHELAFVLSRACAEFTAARVPGQVLDFAHQLHKARGIILGINGASLAMADYINSEKLRSHGGVYGAAVKVPEWRRESFTRDAR